MKKRLKNLIAVVKWLFNYPPINIINLPKDRWVNCMYCGTKHNVMSFGEPPILAICHRCRRSAFDKMLKEEHNGK